MKIKYPTWIKQIRNKEKQRYAYDYYKVCQEQNGVLDDTRYNCSYMAKQAVRIRVAEEEA